MRKLKMIADGNVYIWWATYRHEARTAALFVILSVLFVGYSEFRTMAEKTEKEALQNMLKDERASKMLPNTVYVLEAGTIAQAQQKLARIAGDLDVARYDMGRGK